MKLEDIQSHWAEDSKIEKTNLDDESTKIPALHSKYWKILINEKIVLKNKKNDYLLLKKRKYEYYSGKFSSEDYKDTGWEIFDLRLLKTDIPLYMDSDEHINSLLLEITLQEEKCLFIADIIKSLHNRGYLLKTVMDYMKFTNGA